VSLGESHRLGKGDHEIVAPRVRVLKAARDEITWEVACTILVEQNVKRGRRPIIVVIFCEDIDFGDLPSLAGRYHEIVCGLAIEKI
jgi:hypothetical protein